MHEFALVGLQPESCENPKRTAKRVACVSLRLSTAGAGILPNRQTRIGL